MANDWPKRPAGPRHTAAVTGGRFPDIPASAPTEPVGRRPKAPRPRPTARSRPPAQPGRWTADCLPTRGDRVHRTVQLGGPGLRPSFMATSRRDGTGRPSPGLSSHRTVWARHAAPDPLDAGGMTPCFHHYDRARTRAPRCGAPGKAVHRRAEHRHRPCRRTEVATRPQLLPAPLRTRGGIPHLRGRELPP